MDKSLLLNRGTLPIFEHPRNRSSSNIGADRDNRNLAVWCGAPTTHLELTRIKHRRIVEDLVAASSPEERIKDIINQLFRKGNGGG